MVPAASAPASPAIVQPADLQNHRPGIVHGLAAGWRVLVLALIGLTLALAICWPPPALGLELPDQASSGARLFENHCAGCHINGGNIIRRRQTLRMAALERNGLADPQAIAAVAAAGRGQMSGYGEVLGSDGVEAVAAWVWEQAQQGWPSS